MLRRWPRRVPRAVGTRLRTLYAASNAPTEAKGALEWTSLRASGPNSGRSSASAAIGSLVLDDGVHELCFDVTGSCVIGMAVAGAVQPARAPSGTSASAAVTGPPTAAVIEPHSRAWAGKAWGLDLPSGSLIHASATLLDGAQQAPPALALSGGEQQRMRLLVDLSSRRLTFLDGDDGGGIDAGVRLPGAVRPWVLFPRSGQADEVAPSVRLVSHRRAALPLARIGGLSALVDGLPLQQQALALAWCDAKGAASLGSIVAAGAAGSFLDAFLPEFLPSSHGTARLLALLDHAPALRGEQSGGVSRLFARDDQ